MAHDHHSCECQHERVKFCSRCKVTHCLDCKMEWVEPCRQSHYYGWQSPWTTYTTLAGIGGANASQTLTVESLCSGGHA